MRKKILLVRNAYSFDFGGGERYPVNLAIELEKNGYSPVIASYHTGILKFANENAVPAIKMPWLSIQNFSGWRVALIPFYIVWILYVTIWYVRIILKENIDVLHLQSRDDFIAGTLAGKLLHKRVIWTDHADLKYILVDNKIIYKNIIGKLVLWAAKKTDSIIIVSKNELKLIKHTLHNSQDLRFSVIYNGIRDSTIKPIRYMPSAKTVFVCTSRLVYSKGLRELIDAAGLLLHDDEDAQVLLLGEGPDEKALKKAAPKNVIFLGFPPDALSYLAGAGIFVHPSYNEGFSLSVVEAAMLAKPTIATNVGGTPEIIQANSTGILVPPSDTNSLYTAMKYAIHHPIEMTSYGEALRKKYETKFRFDEIVRRQIIPLYEEKS